MPLDLIFLIQIYFYSDPNNLVNFQNYGYSIYKETTTKYENLVDGIWNKDTRTRYNTYSLIKIADNKLYIIDLYYKTDAAGYRVLNEYYIPRDITDINNTSDIYTKN